MKKIVLNCQMIPRVLIATLFIAAGLSKIGVFGGGSTAEVFRSFYEMLPKAMSFLPVSLAPLVGVLVVVIEIPVAILYALGYKKNWTGGVIALFTALTILFFHFPFTGGHLDFMQLLQALKNLAIIGGIIATLDCFCRSCKVDRTVLKEHHHGHNHH